MRAVIQRVSEAAVHVQNVCISRIDIGLLILLGVEESDVETDAQWLAQKIVGMRIFSDEHDKMNLDIQEVNGDILVVSQFTLHASTKKGNRPSFIKAAKQDQARDLYAFFKLELSKLLSKDVFEGEFGAMMKVYLVNDGPVTIVIDTKNRE